MVELTNPLARYKPNLRAVDIVLTVSPSFLFFTVIHVRICARERNCHEGQTLDYESPALTAELQALRADARTSNIQRSTSNLKEGCRQLCLKFRIAD